MRRDDVRHGSYAGYLAHRAERVRPCKACRLAYNAYMRQWRQKPENQARVRDGNNARTRALWRLAAAHPEDYRRLYLIELGSSVTEEPA